MDEVRELEEREPLPKPKTEDDYDGADYTPLSIQVAAARGRRRSSARARWGSSAASRPAGEGTSGRDAGRVAASAAGACTGERQGERERQGEAWCTRQLTCGSGRTATSTAGSKPAGVATAPKHARVTSAKGWLQAQIPTSERQRLKSEAQATRKRLSAPQLKTVEQWTAGKGMVRRIQTGKVSAATADAFDQAMHDAPKVDGLVYRGVKPGSELAKLAERMRPGTTLRLDEPVSTSVEPGQASSFGTVMFEIESPAAAYVAGVGSKFAYEQEAVLAPGHFKVSTVETVKMHFPGHGVYPVRVIKLQDVSQGERSWRHVDRSALKRAAPDTPDDTDDGDRSDRFTQGDGPGAFYVVNGAQAGRAAGAVTNPGGTERLHEYWVHGEGAKQIAWGTPGDFDRCVMHLGKFIRDPKGRTVASQGAAAPGHIQHVAQHLGAQGHAEKQAIRKAVGIDARTGPPGHDWHGNKARGRSGGGGRRRRRVGCGEGRGIEGAALMAELATPSDQ